MRKYIGTSTALLAALTLFCGCYTYPASQTQTTPLPSPITPVNHTVSLTVSQIFYLFSYHGIPVHLVSKSDTGLTFLDDRLLLEAGNVAGKIMRYATNEEAAKQYKALLSNNHIGKYIYQSHNVLLILSDQFTKAQAEQYKGIFKLIGDIDSMASIPSFLTAAAVSTATPAPTVVPSPIKNSFSDGTYVIGSIMPEGEYAILSSGGRCKVTLTKGTEKKEILYNNGFYHNIILTVKPTEVLTIKNGTAVLLSDCTTLDASCEGMFKAGSQLSPGTYTVSLSDNNLIGFGTIQVLKDSRFQDDSILSARTFTTPIQITLKQGQYINLSGARIIP